MIDERVSALDALPNTLDTSRLERVGKPTHEVLSNLIHHCSPDPATSTVTAAALVLSLWQLRGRTVSDHVPSMLLLDAGEEGPDPVDEFVRGSSTMGRPTAPRRRTGRRSTFNPSRRQQP